MNTQKVTDIDTSINFKGCTKLTSVVIPNSVTWIGTTSFKGCTGLTSVIMEDGENNLILSRNAFDGCTNLTNIRLSSTLTSMSSQVFNNCKSLTSIYIPASVTDIRANDYNPLFNGCSKALKFIVELNLNLTVGVNAGIIMGLLALRLN